MDPDLDQLRNIVDPDYNPEVDDDPITIEINEAGGTNVTMPPGFEIFNPQQSEFTGLSPVRLPTAEQNAAAPDPLDDRSLFERGMESADAGLRLQNPLTGLIYNPSKPDFEPTPDYNPYTDGQIEGYDPDLFVDSESAEETAWIKTRADQENKWREVSGWQGEIFGAVTNPVLAAAGGVGIATRAGVIGTTLLEMGGEAASEALLHDQQVTRTKLESAINVAAAGTVTYLLGRAFGQASAEEVARATSRLERDLTDVVDPDSAARGPTTGDPDSAGAASVYASLEDEGMRGGRAASTFAVGPASRILASSSRTARRVVQQLSDLPFALRKHDRGETYGASVEARVEGYKGLWFRGYEQSRDFYKQYRKRGGRLKWRDFDREVGRAMRRGDEHVEPEIASAAKAWRTQVDEVKARAISAGALPEDVKAKFAKSYFPRAYNFDTPNTLEQLQYALERRFSSGAYKPENMVPGPNGTMVPDPDILEEAAWNARAVADHLRGGGTAPPNAFIVPGASGTKERTLSVPDEWLEDYLDSSASDVLGRHFQEMGTDIELRDMFGGDKTMKSEFATIRDEFNDAIEAASTDRQKARLARERDRTLRDLEAIVGRLTGTFGRPRDPGSAFVKAGRMLRAWTGAAYLGGVVLTSVPDLARPIMQYGLRPYAKGIWQFATNPKRWGVTKKELQRWGAALDVMENTRLMNIADLQGPSGFGAAGRAFERGVGLFTGLAHWTTGAKIFAGGLAQDVILETAIKSTTQKGARTNAVRKLARAGIDRGMARRIAKQFEQFGDTQGPLRLATTDLWEDREAAMALEAAVRSEVGFVLQDPKAADRWLWTSNEVGKTVGQFQAFVQSSTNRGLVSGLQRADASYFSGLMFSVALGAFSTAVKDMVRDRDPMARDPEAMLMDAIDRSGVLGAWSTPMNIARRFAGDTPSRFLGKGLTAQFVGPGVGGVIPQAIEGVSYGLKGDTDEAVQAAMRLLPYANVFHLRDILQRAGALPS